MTNFDRYSSFNANGKLKIVPFIKITKKGSDRYIIYNKKTMRLDKISNDFYNNPDNEGHMWFALQNHGDKTFKVEAGQGFGQGIFMKYYTVDEEEVINERTGWSGKPDERGN